MNGTGVAVPFTLVNTVPELPPLIVVVVGVSASTVKVILHCPSVPLPTGLASLATNRVQVPFKPLGVWPKELKLFDPHVTVALQVGAPVPAARTVPVSPDHVDGVVEVAK